MSKGTQRGLAVAVLAGTLLLTVPAPSLAAGFWRPAAEAPGWAIRAWLWLEVAVWGKQGSAIDPDGVPTVVVWEKEGSAIDPDGAPRPATAGEPAPFVSSRSGDNPDGAQ